MTRDIAVDFALTEVEPPVIAGLRVLTGMAWQARDFQPLVAYLTERARENGRDAAALIDLSIIEHLRGNRSARLSLQARALDAGRIFRNMPATKVAAPLRLVAFVAPGDFMANTPVEFLLEDSSVILDTIYVLPDAAMPAPIPEHDVAFVAIAESDENQPLLEALGKLLPSWPRPVLNQPAAIARLTRDGTADLLDSAPGVVMPVNRRVDRATLESLANDETALARLMGGEAFPLITRPVGSHAGLDLQKLERAKDIKLYLAKTPAEDFYLASFVDYRSPDGLYRKYRIILIDGQAYACHLAISNHWMVHYLNADMIESAQNRDEEARFMRDFDIDFGSRHSAALAELHERIGLDYLPFDCAETRDGRLLIFEVGTNMIVHAMDSAELFPYKRAQMAKVFAAFEQMLVARARG